MLLLIYSMPHSNGMDSRCKYIQFCCKGGGGLTEIKSLHTKVTWGGDSEILGVNAWGGGVREVYVIHYIKKGAGTLEVSGRSFHLTAGQSFLIYPDTPVKYYPDKDDPWQYVWIDFAGMAIKDILVHIDVSPSCPVFPAIDSSPIEFFEKLNGTLYDNKFNYKYRALERLSCLYAILSYYSEHYSKKVSLQENDFFEAILNYINNNRSLPELNVASISDAFNIDRSTLFRLFQKNLNKSPIEYICELRISNATDLLTSTNLPIKTVAASVGFKDALYFSRFFKRHTGYSPREYRTNNKSD